MPKCLTCGKEMGVLRRDLDVLYIFGSGLLSFLISMGIGVNIWLSLVAAIVGMGGGAVVAVTAEEARTRKSVNEPKAENRDPKPT